MKYTVLNEEEMYIIIPFKQVSDYLAPPYDWREDIKEWLLAEELALFTK